MKRKQLTREERRGETAFALWQELEKNQEAQRKLRLRNIDILDQIYQEQLYKDILGDENAKWTALLTQKELSMTRAEVAKSFRIKHKLINEFGFTPEALAKVKISRLDDVVRFAETKEQATDLLNKAEAFTATDWGHETRHLLGKPIPDDGHKHDYKTIRVCEFCRHKEAVNN